MIVIDSSAVVEWLLRTPAGFRVAHRVNGAASTLHAPELIFVEAAHAFRKMVFAGTLMADRAEQALRHVVTLRIRSYPHLPLLGRIWQLRNSVSAYDAAYIALAEKLNATVLTCDRRLGAAHGHFTQIEVF